GIGSHIVRHLRRAHCDRRGQPRLSPFAFLYAPTRQDASRLLAPGIAGSHMVKVAPPPVWLAASIQPSCSSTMRRATDNPGPVLLPPCLVEKRGSKMGGSFSGGFPERVPDPRSPKRAPPFPRLSSGATSISNRPPCAIACSALMQMFISDCRSRAGSPSTKSE